MSGYTYARLFIGEDIYYNLPEEEQEKYERYERYKPDAVGQIMHDDRNNEFRDGCFDSISDYEDFWGDDFSQTGGFVYVRNFNSFYLYSEEKWRKYFKQFSEGVTGNQIRVKLDGRKQEIRDCVIISWKIFTTLTGKDKNANLYRGQMYANSTRGHSKSLLPKVIKNFEGDAYFKDKKELAEFFGISEELKELDGRKYGKIQARLFTKRLTEEQKATWMEKAIDGTQVKIIEIWW